MTLSPDTTPSKEQQLALRAAFVKGWENWMANCNPHVFAAKAFPLPKIERPRVVVEGDTSWRVIDGEFEDKSRHGGWRKSSNAGWSPIAKRVAIWADLLANPTELIDDDGGDQ